MSTSENTPPIFDKLGPKDRGHLLKAREAIAKQREADNMSSEQT